MGLLLLWLFHLFCAFKVYLLHIQLSIPSTRLFQTFRPKSSSLTATPNEFFQWKRVITPIGTLASPAFCRDKGQMWGRVGALCLSSSLFDSSGFREARWSHPNEDKHKAPSSTPPHPLSLQDGLRLLLHSVVKIQ
jgi:hypothetical protein